MIAASLLVAFLQRTIGEVQILACPTRQVGFFDTSKVGPKRSQSKSQAKEHLFENRGSSKQKTMSSTEQRRVRFRLEPAIMAPLQEAEYTLTPSQIADTWYSPEEFRRLRIESNMVASGIRHRYETDKSNRLSYGNVLLSTYKSCVGGEYPSQDTVHHLASWLEVAASRRGLEKLSQKELHKQRRQSVSSAILSVLNTQNAFKDESFDARADRLRLVYEKVSAPAILFARALALADELAARQDASTANSRDGMLRGNAHKTSLRSMKQWNANACGGRLASSRLQTLQGMVS